MQTAQLGRARLRRRARGVTLFEVLIVVAILALIASGVGVMAFRHWIEAQQSTAETSARSLRGIVKIWWMQHGSSSCPDIEQLRADGALDTDSTGRDPWGNPWRIQCSETDVSVRSDGRDRREGTADDIRVPPT